MKLITLIMKYRIEKTCLRPDPTQIRLYNHIYLAALFSHMQKAAVLMSRLKQFQHYCQPNNNNLSGVVPLTILTACKAYMFVKTHRPPPKTCFTFSFDPTYKNPCWKENDTLHCLPYFFLIGVKKSGTTALWKHIASHPDFAFRRIKKEQQWFAVRRFNGTKS